MDRTRQRSNERMDDSGERSRANQLEDERPTHKRYKEQEVPAGQWVNAAHLPGLPPAE